MQIIQNSSLNIFPKDLVSTQSMKQRSQKKVQVKQQDKYDIYSVMSSCVLINNLIEIDGFLNISFQTSDHKDDHKNGIDILLNFVSSFYSSLASSVDEFMNASNGSYSIGNVIFKQNTFSWHYIIFHVQP